MQVSTGQVNSELEILLRTCKSVPPSQMQLNTAVSVARFFFTSAPACKEWDGAAHDMSQCLARVAQALAHSEWAPEFLNFVRSNISKSDVLGLLQSISQIVSEAMVAVLYFFMSICCSTRPPEWSILFTGSQSLSQSVTLVAQLLQVAPALTFALFMRLMQVPPSPIIRRRIQTRSRNPSFNGCCSVCHGPPES